MAVEIVVNARSGRQVEVEKSKTVNNGHGASHYLLKKDEKTGKRLFYHPSEWASLNAEQKKEAMDFTPRASDTHRRDADRIVEHLASREPAHPQGRGGVAQERAARQPWHHRRGHRRAAGSEGREGRRQQGRDAEARREGVLTCRRGRRGSSARSTTSSAA
jgi:hypothetical protein